MSSRTIARGLVLASTLLIVGASGAWTTVNGAGTITVAGTFRYGDFDPDTGITTLRPIAFAKVEVWRFRPRGWFGIWAWANDRIATTDGNGSVAVPMTFVAPGVIHAVRVFAENYAATVWPNDVAHTLPFYREPDEPDGAPRHLRAAVPGETLDFSYDFREAWSAQHFNIAETLRHGFDYARSRRVRCPTGCYEPDGDRIWPVNVQPTSVTGSWYNPVVDTVVIGSDAVFADFEILHEYAHYLEEQISSFAWIPTIHDGCVAYADSLAKVLDRPMNSPEHAWMEGFANYFAQAVARSLTSGTLGGMSVSGTARITELERPTCPSRAVEISGDAVELMVAGTLWDLFDQPTDPGSVAEVHDGLARFDKEIFQIFDRELDVYGTGPTISAFRSAWRDRGLPLEALDAILDRHRIPRAGS